MQCKRKTHLKKTSEEPDLLLEEVNMANTKNAIMARMILSLDDSIFLSLYAKDSDLISIESNDFVYVLLLFIGLKGVGWEGLWIDVTVDNCQWLKE